MHANRRFMLTMKDFTILEAILDRCPEPSGPFAELLRRKLSQAEIWSRDDIPPSVATLNSRVRYRIDGGASDVRVLSQDSVQGLVGMLLPVTGLRGLALLGLSVGQGESVVSRDQRHETVLLEEIVYQPEAVQRAEFQRQAAEGQFRIRPSLRLVHDAEPNRRPAPIGRGDDPGPTAA